MYAQEKFIYLEQSPGGKIMAMLGALASPLAYCLYQACQQHSHHPPCLSFLSTISLMFIHVLYLDPRVIYCNLLFVSMLVGGLEHLLLFHNVPYLGFFIIPTDELILFRGVGLNHQPVCHCAKILKSSKLFHRAFPGACRDVEVTLAHGDVCCFHRPLPSPIFNPHQVYPSDVQVPYELI